MKTSKRQKRRNDKARHRARRWRKLTAEPVPT